MAQETKRFAGNIPENYQRYLVPLLFEPYARHLLKTLAPIEGGAVLELACGTGALSGLLRQHLKDEIRLVSTDVSLDMLEIANRELGTVAGLELQVADAMDLPFPNDCFETVICQFGIMVFPNKRRGLTEMFRILKPGGRAYVSVWDDVVHNEFINTANQTVQALELSEPINILGGFSYTDIDEIKADFEAAGFESLDISVVQKTSEAPNIDFAINGVMNGTSLANQLEAQGLLDTGRTAIYENFNSVFGQGRANAQMQAIFCTTSKPL